MTAPSGSRDLGSHIPNHRDVNLHLTADPSPQTAPDTNHYTPTTFSHPRALITHVKQLLK